MRIILLGPFDEIRHHGILVILADRAVAIMEHAGIGVFPAVDACFIINDTILDPSHIPPRRPIIAHPWFIAVQVQEAGRCGANIGDDYGQVEKGLSCGEVDIPVNAEQSIVDLREVLDMASVVSLRTTTLLPRNSHFEGTRAFRVAAGTIPSLTLH